MVLTVKNHEKVVYVLPSKPYMSKVLQRWKKCLNPIEVV